MQSPFIHVMTRASGRFAAVALVLASAGLQAAGGGVTQIESPVVLERVPGSEVPRITLTARAAERLGIETATVDEATVERTQVVGGVIVEAPAGARPAQGGMRVEVRLSEAEFARLAPNKAARLLPLVIGSRFAGEILAEPVDMEPVRDDGSRMLSRYYAVSEDTALEPGDRVRVELPLSGTDGPEKVVPYSAVYYDSTGRAWVYVTETDLVYERKPIVIDGIVGDLVVLSRGPPLGTSVVSVGAALLYGTEIFGK